ncbi:hypothetical protein [Campylobacter fetus]|uniref:hypothetical protein n=1 Tax=Campylobacter fetus TaxID=196 RepID=UPI00073A863B|nr:hypothetical protein [Campylobacter fetus]ALV65026.1 hypothetical protein CFTSP3_1061 [Campylobacter fetus subsp. testudinum Sp3]
MTQEELTFILNDQLHNILYFKEDIKWEKPHYYIIIPTQDTDKIVILSMITSQVEKRKSYYKENKKALECLVEVTNKEIPLLTYDISLIDCNRTFETTKEELLTKFPDIKVYSKDINIPINIINKIIAGINHSPMIKPNIKKLIDKSKLKLQ